MATTSTNTLVSRRSASYSARVNGIRRIRARTCRPLHGEQLAGVLHGIDAKEEQAVQREHRSNQPKAEGDRGDDGERGEGSAAERAERVEDVARQVIDETGASRVATLVGGKRHRAEARDRPGASVDGTQAGGDVLLCLAFDMERELLVELAFDAAAEPPTRESAGTDRGDSCGHASFITRPMAVDMRSQLAGFHRQLPAPGGREPVVLGPPAQLRDSPFGFDPALMLEAMERRVERALVDLQDILRDLLDPLRNRPAMERLGLQRAQDEQVKGTGSRSGTVCRLMVSDVDTNASWCRLSTPRCGGVVALISSGPGTPAVQRQAAKAGKADYEMPATKTRKDRPRKHENTKTEL